MTDCPRLQLNMIDLCIRDLVQIVGGRLRLGSPPPLGGPLEPIGRIVADSRQVVENDVFWGLVGPNHDGSRFAEDAFLRGALGAVVSGRRLEPWAGKFSLEVQDTHHALWRLARWIRERSSSHLYR